MALNGHPTEPSDVCSKGKSGRIADALLLPSPLLMRRAQSSAFSWVAWGELACSAGSG